MLTITVDNPEAITITTEGWDSDAGQYVTTNLFDPVTEVNQYEYESGAYTSIYIRPRDNYKLVSIIDNGQDVLYGNSYYSLTASDYANGKVYNVTTADLSAVRTATATFNIDDASKVRLAYGGSAGEVKNLVNGTNLVKFDPATEGRFQIGSAVYSEPIFQVKLDGDVVADSWGTWYVNCVDGSVVDITAAWPDEDYTVKIVTPENCPGLIQYVKNSSTYEDIPGDFTTGVALKSGTKITIQADGQQYNIDNILINGVAEQYPSSTWSGQVKDRDITIEYQAHPYGTFDVIVNVNDPEAVNIYKASYADSSALLEITEGENTITYQEQAYASYYLFVAPAGDNVINTLTVKHADSEEAEETSARMFTVKAGDVITIDAGPRVADQIMYVWIDPAAVEHIADIKLTRYDNSSYSTVTVEQLTEFSAGNNQMMYSKSDMPMTIEFATKHPDPIPDGYQPWYPYVFVNNNLVSEYRTYTAYITSDIFKSGDVVRAYDEIPEECELSIQIGDDVDPNLFEVLYDEQPIAEWATLGTVKVFSGSTISVKLPANEVEGDDESTTTVSYSCELDNVELTPDDNNVCSFTVSGNQTLVLRSMTTVGIENVAVDAKSIDTNVYNMQGIRVADASDVKNLPAGIYITGGRKIVVK